MTDQQKTLTDETTDQPGEALQVALAYYRAWTNGDFEQAMTYISPDIECQAPPGPVRGAEAFREFMGPFAQMLKGSELLAAFGQGDTALIMYNTETPPVAEGPGAEWHTVSDGKITSMRLIFDRLPFHLAEAAAKG